MEFFQKNCLYGKYILINDDLVCNMMKEFGFFAKFEIEFFRSFLKENDNVIEIGSFIGTHTIPIKKMIKSGKILCFEPQHHIFKILCSNLLLNNCHDVIALPYGIGHDELFKTYWKRERCSNFSLKDKSNDKSHLISIKSIKHFEEYYNTFDNLKLIKIDVEGLELEVLNDILFLIIKYQPFIFIEYGPETLKYVNDFFEKINYECYYFNTTLQQYYNENTKVFFDEFKEIVDINDERIKNVGDYNILAIPIEIPKKPNLQKVNNVNMYDAKINNLDDIDLHWFN